MCSTVNGKSISYPILPKACCSRVGSAGGILSWLLLVMLLCWFLANWLSLVLPGLWKCRQSCGLENSEQETGCCALGWPGRQKTRGAGCYLAIPGASRHPGINSTDVLNQCEITDRLVLFPILDKNLSAFHHLVHVCWRSSNVEKFFFKK